MSGWRRQIGTTLCPQLHRLQHEQLLYTWKTHSRSHSYTCGHHLLKKAQPQSQVLSFTKATQISLQHAKNISAQVPHTHRTEQILQCLKAPGLWWGNRVISVRERSASAKCQSLDRRSQGACVSYSLCREAESRPGFPRCSQIASVSSEGDMHLCLCTYGISPFPISERKLPLITMHCLVKSIILLHRAHTLTINI